MNIKKMDASLPLIFPNPSLGMNLTVFCFLLSLPIFVMTDNSYYLSWFLLLMLVQLFIFVVGIFYTRNKVKNLLSLFAAPLFLIWKLVIDVFSAAGMGRHKWIRTERKL